MRLTNDARVLGFGTMPRFLEDGEINSLGKVEQIRTTLE